MGIFLGSSSLASSGGGGGGGTPGTETIMRGGLSYNVFTSDLADNFTISTGGPKPTIGLSNLSATFQPAPSINHVPDSSIVTTATSTVTISASTLPQNTAGNNVYSTILDHTGSGIFYWANVTTLMQVNSDGTQGENHQTGNGAGIRITIDGGTPIEYNSGNVTGIMNSTITNATGNYLYLAAQPVWTRNFATIPFGNPAFASSDTTSFTPSTTYSSRTLAVGGTALEATGLVYPATAPHTATDLLQINGYNSKLLRLAGVPGFMYESSIQIEVLHSSLRGGTNLGLSTGSITRDSVYCVEQFT